MKNGVLSKRLFIYFIAAFFLAFFSFAIYTLVSGGTSFGQMEGWDGVSVATGFAKGNGTEENPYVIQDAAEFIYFKRLIEGEESSFYHDKYYALEDDINFNGNSFTPIGVMDGEEERFFAGHLDGNGHALVNFRITEATTIGDKEYYSLFSKTDNAFISSLGLVNFRIVAHESKKEQVISSFIGEVIGLESKKEEELSTEMEVAEIPLYKNIYLREFYLDFSKASSEHSTVGVLIGNIDHQALVRNVFLHGEINSNHQFSSISFVQDSLENIGNLSVFVANIKVLNGEENSLSYSGIQDVYYYDHGTFYNSLDEAIAEETVLSFLNDDIEEDYYWTVEDDELVIHAYQKAVMVSTPMASKGFSFSLRKSSSITLHDSGLDGNTFYINDITADYNYLTGLNYTEVRNTSLPTGHSGYYNDEYLVKTQIIYDGHDINNSSLVGSMSPVSGENAINSFVYYKYYALERDSNGTLLTNSDGDYYIRIELIDNPFSKRPYVSNKEYGFNGWVCNQDDDTTDDLCESSIIKFVKDNYTRYMEVPVDGGSEIVIHLNASWIEADVVTSSSNITSFNTMSMQRLGTFSHNTMETVNGNAYWKQNYTTMVYSRSYVYDNGYMPRYSWYKTSQTGSTYTYISGRYTRCTRGYTCYVYNANTSGIVGGTRYVSGSYSFIPNYVSNNNNTEITINNYDSTYMDFVIDPNGNFTDTVQVPHYTLSLSAGDTTSGFFYKVSSPTATMISTGEYYQGNGNLCTNASSCTTSYKLIRYNDSVSNTLGNTISLIEENNGEAVDNDKYYYLVTRDTNIFRYTSTTSLNVSNIQVNRPFTVTGTTVNGTSTSGVLSLNGGAFTPSNDVVIENIKIYGPNSQGTRNITAGNDSKTANVIYANSHNLKIGRNVTSSRGSNFLVAESVLGGTNSSLSGTFKVIVESGKYYAFHSGVMSGSTSYTFNETAILGNDYDRILTTNNSKLKFLIGLDGFSGGRNTAGSDSLFAAYTVFKSGLYGYNDDGTPNNDTTAGMYIGGYNGLIVNSLTGVKIEGGNISYATGGYGYNGGETTNATYIGMSGGTIRSIYGGAGYSTTKGNRIINVTGGTVSYSILGGSDSYSSNSTTDGVVNGSTLIYVGGTAHVGGGTGEVQGVEAGNVFGAGGGNSNSTQKGTVRNSHIIINGGTIESGVYGGGNYGSTGTQYANTSTTVIDILSGNIGNVFGGSKAAGFSSSDYRERSTININVTGGTIGNIYGGSDDKGTIYGTVNINAYQGTVTTNVYGGGKGANTFVDGTVNVNIGDTVSNQPTINGSVYGGSAYGTVNSSSTNGTVHGTTNVLVNNGVIQGNVYGGGQGSSTETPYVRGNITVTVNAGSIGKVFGGFDAAGTPGAGDTVYLNGGTIGDAFGGGNQTGQTTTNIYLQGARITNALYGGSNLLGTVTTSNVYITSGYVKDVFGGNNLGGNTVDTNVTITGGRFLGDVYGGGNEAPCTTSTVLIRIAPVNDVYGGGKQAGLTTSNVTIRNASFNNMYGGSNISGNVGTSNISITTTSGSLVFGGNNQGGMTNDTNISVSSSTLDIIYGGGDNATSGVSHVILNSGSIGEIYGGGNEAGLTTSNITILDGSVGAVFGGSNQTGNVTTSNIIVGNVLTDPLTVDIQIGSLYGGNNSGGVTSATNITSYMGTITQLFGGGNEASVGDTTVNLSNTTLDEVYGGGNAAGVSGDTYLNLGGCTVTDSVYGGGNEGVVDGNTEVIIEDTVITGNAYAGGNGSTAIVSGDSTITIKGTTQIGTSSSVAPNSGCVFGSGNAANTGTLADNDSKATVNITGGTIYGNVYGGPKMAVVYGTTETNIGSSALAPNAMVNTPILIHGTVFGGGESNASGSTTYDWTFISVTEGITVNIDGTNYTSRGIVFAIHGSIFGSGNASSSSGDSEIYIKSLGTLVSPNKSVSIQRANYLEIESSAIELEGATDRTNDYSDILYSLNIIDKMVIKNGTALLLQHNANLLKELYSGVDVGSTLVPAEVEIDTENREVGRNVDNRIYMLPGQNLNVTINQNATAYGKVTGMTFFGMYQPYEGGYRYGLYDPSYDYDDPADAGLEIIGGSYVVGLHSANHDITKDGFYSNYLKETTFDKIVTAYIDPTPIGETGYRWTIGFEAINYEFTLTASKYSSLGTTELQLSDFATGDAIFSVLGVDTSGLNTGISLVDSSLVPRVGRTLVQANQTLGLTMKAETQEWMGYGSTKFYSADGGTVIGTREYRTDSRQLPPSLMFYLYHAKNIATDGPLGNVVITVQVATPKNAIEYNIDFITITANIVARQFDDGDSYDASITYDKRYEMPSATLVNITNTSQFTAYFSLIAWNNQFSGVYGTNNENFHVLITDSPLPVNTMITMLDFGANENRPEYYYFRVTQAVYDNTVTQLETYNEVTYPLSQFIKMDSTSTTNTYSDSASNLLYYDSDIGLVDEEFIFIFDFKECTQVTGDHLDHSVLFELRNSENRTVFTVLGIREAVMYYSTYEATNIVLNQTIGDFGDYLYYSIPDTISYTTNIQYDETENRQSVIDTNYESSSMGLNIAFLDRDGEPVSSSLLIGTYFMINNQQYFADSDGVFRIKLSDKVSNLIRSASLMVYKNLPAGEYTVRYTLFASDDGLHNSNPLNSVSQSFTVTVVSADNSLIVDGEPYTEIVDGLTGLNMNNSRLNTYTVQYQSVLSNPNFRVEVYKRSTNNVDDAAYNSIGFHYLFTNDFFSLEGNEVSISMDGRARKNFDFQLQTTDNLTSGTYRVVFKLYDNNQLIDSDEKYVIVHKNIQ